MEVAALVAGVIAQFIRAMSADRNAARPVMEHALVADWHISSAQATKLVDAALELTHRSLDIYRITRELNERTAEAERVALLDTLFAIANAGDRVAPAEIDEIRLMAERLNLTRQQFVTAKLKIPAADRGGL